jgi:nitrate/nitrite transporter NarK
MVAFSPADRSRFDPADISDPAALAHALKSTERMDSPQAQTARTVWAVLPPEAVATVEAIETHQGIVTTEQRQRLAEGLNTVLASPELTQRIDLANLEVPAEARRLAARPVAARTPAQTELLNRLVLEAAFDKSLRKLFAASWRPVALLYGAVGIAVALVFWWYVRDWPRQHPGCNVAEVALIEGEPSEAGARPAAADFPWNAVLTSRSLWFSSLAQFFTNFGWIVLANWVPRYLLDVHKVPLAQRGLMASVPFLVGLTGMIVGGWWTDGLTRRHGLYWGRTLPQVLTRFAVMTAFFACLLCQTPWPVVLLLAVVALATDTGTPAIWAFCQDVGGRHTAAVLGWTNMWGNLGAALSPLVLEPLIDPLGWQAVFLACAGAFLLSGLAAFGMDARQRIG